MALLKWGVAMVVIAALELGSGQAPPSGLSEAQAKAAVLYNLALFVQWPPEAFDSSANLHFGIIRADQVMRALQGVEGRVVNGRTVRIRSVRPDDDQACHVLYIPELDREGQAWLDKVDGKPVLTVSDDERFLKAGGMIRVSFVDSRVRFDIDIGHAERAGLKISSKALSLAKVVRDGRVVKP
jgi:uncharacterized protein DUF4154